MHLLQQDNIKYIAFCFLLLILPPKVIAAEDFSNKKYKENIDIKKLVNKSTLNCSFDSSSESLVSFYNNLMRNSIIKVKKGHYSIGNSYTVNGIKLISTDYKKNNQERSVNMDTDFEKFGVRLLRVSGFIQGGEYENFGYYIILKNNPSKNIKILKNFNVDMKYSTVEETEGGNTRVRCILVG